MRPLLSAFRPYLPLKCSLVEHLLDIIVYICLPAFLYNP
uniref:Uncharacterized protein n=1 Tax=Aegilops tauschii subsp. strangulata TaxID=200361 RepID=A0A453RBN1_AEGTS